MGAGRRLAFSVAGVAVIGFQPAIGLSETITFRLTFSMIPDPGSTARLVPAGTTRTLVSECSRKGLPDGGGVICERQRSPDADDVDTLRSWF
jgi:hypothetical protein